MASSSCIVTLFMFLSGIDRFAAGLDLAGQDRGDLVVAERAPLALLDEIDGVLGHPQDIAAQRVTGPHRGGDVGLDPISKGHRNGYLGRAGQLGLTQRIVAASADGDPVALGRARRCASGWRWLRSGPVSARAGPAPGPGRSAGLRPGVLLALRFLALALHAGLLVVLASASLCQNAALLDLLVEASQGTLEGLVFAYADFSQSGITSHRQVSCHTATRMPGSERDARSVSTNHTTCGRAALRPAKFTRSVGSPQSRAP